MNASASILAIDGGTPAVSTPEGNASALPATSVSRLMPRIERLIVDGNSRVDAVRGSGVIRDFESAIGARAGAEYAVSTASGTTALMAALLACGVHPGDEVIVSTYGWGGTVGAVLAIGAVPRFADIDGQTYNIDPASVAKVITNRTRAILATHLFGHPADVSGLMNVATNAGVLLIFDAAQALGATYLGKPIGAWGDMAVLSFGRGKIVETFEGGAVLTSNAELFERLILLTQHPLRSLREIEDRSIRRYVDETGLSCRMHPVAAAIGLEELEALNDRLRRRRDRCLALAAALKGVPGIVPPAEVSPGTHTFHQFALSYRQDELGGLPREATIRILQGEGVPVTAGPVRIPIHRRGRFLTSTPSLAITLSDRLGSVPPTADAPVAERRCSFEELMIESESRWLAVPEERIAEIVVAFRKLASGCAHRQKSTNQEETS